MEDNLRMIFADICRGYTVAKWKDTVYIKHLTHFDQVDIDACYERFLKIAIDKKLPTKAEKTEWLEKKKLWTRKMEANISTQKAYVENLEKTLKLLFLKSQIDEHKKTLATERKKYEEILREKNELLGLTAEKYAEQKMFCYYIFVSFYKDEELKKRLFTEKQFNDLDENEIDELFSIYLEINMKMNEKNLKKIAVSSFFTSYFYISNDIKAFFGKPICSLSYNQLNLMHYASYYKQIIENVKIPENIREEPEKIEEFATASVKAKEMLEKNGGKGSIGIVGATNADMDYLGVENKYDPMMKKAIKRGGISSIEEAATI